MDNYDLAVSLMFTRHEGEGNSTTHTIHLGNDGDSLYPLVQALLDFVQSLGFGYVASIQACNDEGKVIASSVNT